MPTPKWPRASSHRLPAVAGRETAAEQLRRCAQEALRALELRLKPEHPDVMRSKRTIAELQQRADAEAAARPVSSERRRCTPAEAVRRRPTGRPEDRARQPRQADRAQDRTRRSGCAAFWREYQRRIEATPTRESELADLTRDYGTLQAAYRQLAGEEAGFADLGQPRAAADRRAVQDSRSGTAADEAVQRRIDRGSTSLGIFGGIAFGLALAGAARVPRLAGCDPRTTFERR